MTDCIVKCRFSEDLRLTVLWIVTELDMFALLEVVKVCFPSIYRLRVTTMV